jgi:hypothetical protein
MSNRAAFRGDIRSRFSIANSQQVLPLAKVAFEPHALGDIEQSLANRNPACYINTGRCPHGNSAAVFSLSGVS